MKKEESAWFKNSVNKVVEYLKAKKELEQIYDNDKGISLVIETFYALNTSDKRGYMNRLSKMVDVLKSVLREQYEESEEK